MSRFDPGSKRLLSGNRRGEKSLAREQMRESDGTQSRAGMPEKAAAIHQRMRDGRMWRVHGMNKNSFELSNARQSAGSPSRATNASESWDSRGLGSRLYAIAQARRI